MIINGKNYLFFERRGCEFFKHLNPGDVGSESRSDIGNYRITTPGEIVPLKNGKNYLFEFSHYDRFIYRKTNKRTGAPLKNPVRELYLKNAASISTEYTNAAGSFADLALEKDFYSRDIPYTEGAILNYINDIAAEHYDAIKYVREFVIYVSPEWDYTPHALMLKYAKEHPGIKTEYGIYGELLFAFYDGLYRYLCLKTDHGAGKNNTDNIAIYLERIEAAKR